ncbi:hypothetical protein ACIOWK_12950 [Pseudomonas protegens]|uniref:hypothetical protein n=1 Tax=Pseudomonas protegens TaxID=380021 RepID=UPI003817E675
MADGEQQHDNSWTDDVLTPSFYLARRPNENGFSANLYLQIFEQVETGSWRSLPEEQWHLLASIDPGWITMYPIYTNPHTQRYRSPRHGNVQCIIYEASHVHDVPDNTDDALLHNLTKRNPRRSCALLKRALIGGALRRPTMPRGWLE